MSDSTRAIDLTIDIDAPRDAVWRTLTDPSEIPRWLAPSAKVQPGEAGFIEVSWGEGMTGRNTIEVWEPPNRLVAGHSGLREEYVLSEKGGGTSLKLHHSGFPANPEGEAYRKSVENGWCAFFAMLGHGASRNAGKPFKNVTLFTQLSAGSREAAWDSIVNPGGVTKQGLPRLEPGSRYDVELFSGSRLHGTVLHSLWPGYLVLIAENLDDSLLALLCEGAGDGAMLTITWILNGNAAKREHEIKSTWEGWVKR